MNHYLYPDVEKRMREWLQREERLRMLRSRRDLGKSQGGTICLSRKFGCEAYPVAESLKRKLGKITGKTWTIFDKELIEAVSKQEGIALHLLENLGDTSLYVDSIITNLSSRWHTQSDAYKLLAKYVIKVAREGLAIIVGRGAACLTKDLRNCYQFHLDGSLEFRARSVASRLAIPIEEAHKVISAQQHRREKFYRSFLGCDLHDFSIFHAIFNNDRLTSDEIADCIVEMVDVG